MRNGRSWLKLGLLAAVAALSFGCAMPFSEFARKHRDGGTRGEFALPIDDLRMLTATTEFKVIFDVKPVPMAYATQGEDSFELRVSDYICNVGLSSSGPDRTRVHALCGLSAGYTEGDSLNYGSKVEKQVLGNITQAVAKARLNKKSAVSSGLGKEELSAIVQAAVEGTTKAQAKAAEQSKGVESDIDKPGYKHAERPNDFAVVVGIGKYSDLPEAQFAERDAEAVKNHLLALGFPSRNVIHLTGERAGYKGIEKFVETWLPKNVEADSRVLFYFSGHGAPDARTGQAYLLPYDGDPSFLENTGYPVKRLYEKLSALKAKNVVVALDACFSGAGGRSVLAKGARPLVLKTDAAAIPGNLTVLAAASGEQITSTLEDQGHGTFTYYFLKGLGGGGKDGSGAVTAQSLHNYLKPKVQDAARRQNRDQEPVMHGPGDQELVRF